MQKKWVEITTLLYKMYPAMVAEWAKVLPQIQVEARRMSQVLILLWVGSISTSHDKGIHATFHTIKASLL